MNCLLSKVVNLVNKYKPVPWGSRTQAETIGLATMILSDSCLVCWTLFAHPQRQFCQEQGKAFDLICHPVTVLNPSQIKWFAQHPGFNHSQYRCLNLYWTFEIYLYMHLTFSRIFWNKHLASVNHCIHMKIEFWCLWRDNIWKTIFVLGTLEASPMLTSNGIIGLRVVGIDSCW